MTKLHAVLAKEKHIKATSNAQINELYDLLKKPKLFSGLVRTYQKKSDSSEDLPSESQEIQIDLNEVLAQFRKSLLALIDVTTQKDLGNQNAKASIVVDGYELIANVPATTLLSLEKLSALMRGFISEIPVLDTAESWTLDANSGVSKTSPTQTHRTKKIQKPIVLYDATEHHPAQTQIITEDEVVGWWNTQKTSTAMAKSDKQRLLERVDKLLLAIKDARERANDTDVAKHAEVGAKIFSYLFDKVETRVQSGGQSEVVKPGASV